MAAKLLFVERPGRVLISAKKTKKFDEKNERKPMENTTNDGAKEEARTIQKLCSNVEWRHNKHEGSTRMWVIEDR